MIAISRLDFDCHGGDAKCSCERGSFRFSYTQGWNVDHDAEGKAFLVCPYCLNTMRAPLYDCSTLVAEV